MRRLTDEVVVLSGPEFESAGLRRERTEGDGEVHELVGLVADGDDARIGIGDATRIVLFFGHVVDDVLFGVLLVRARRVHGTNDVDLVVFERNVVLVDVDDVVRVVYPESVSKRNSILSHSIRIVPPVLVVQCHEELVASLTRQTGKRFEVNKARGGSDEGDGHNR